MSVPGAEPSVAVGLIEQAPSLCFELQGEYALEGAPLSQGAYSVRAEGRRIVLVDPRGNHTARARQLCISPRLPPEGRIEIKNIPIGKDFHWQRFQNQKFQGDMLVAGLDDGKLGLVNRLPLEQYLEAVICSEMNPGSPPEFLRAHCIISRSWLLAQLQLKKRAAHAPRGGFAWTDARAHTRYDVCADDHCQRYHGTGAVNPAASAALQATRGQVLVHAGGVCDARFSKCCGGMTERYSTAWEDRDIAYLQPVPDGPAGLLARPLDSEAAVRQFITSRPPAFCNVNDRRLLARLLPAFDFETQDFFRWQTTLSQAQIGALLLQKTGVDFGGIRDIIPQARGASGRAYRLLIIGERHSRTFGKELEIRRILSPTHLYSSAFVVEPRECGDRIPGAFVFKGAGWGHGVGLCQIGAAVMAAGGYTYEKILQHYFRGVRLKKIY